MLSPQMKRGSRNGHNDFVYQSMITCIGNKRKLVENIIDVFNEVRELLSKKKLNIVDGFSGSSIVSRELSYISKNLYTNDLEYYSYLMCYCYLKTPNQQERIQYHISTMNELAKDATYEGIICKTYAPKNTNDIQPNERCFYTRENALIIDTLRKYIDDNVEKELQPYCLAPLLNKASIHANTGGVFNGFYKCNGIGSFGGNKKTSLPRIFSPIELDMPIWNKSRFNVHLSNVDINELVNDLPKNIDVMYLDPPYNQHPYGSNYFMLNVIARNEVPDEITKVSGIPKNWNRSNYNTRDCTKYMKSLIEVGLSKSKYLIISYNNEGIMDIDELLKSYQVKKYEIDYSRYRDNKKVIELIYLVSI